MYILDRLKSIRSVMVGAVITGIALVIANAWGQAIKKSVTLFVNKIKCGKLIHLRNNKRYKDCTKNDAIGLYINAIVTTILLALFVLVLFGKSAVKKMKVSIKSK